MLLLAHPHTMQVLLALALLALASSAEVFFTACDNAAECLGTPLNLTAGAPVAVVTQIEAAYAPNTNYFLVASPPPGFRVI